MAQLTGEEVLNVFETGSAIKNSDQILIAQMVTGSTVAPVKITAEILRAYMNKGFEITVGDDGLIYIGGHATTVNAGVINMKMQTELQVEIKPNELNVWEDAVEELAITFEQGNPSQANEYMLQFTVLGDNFTLSLPQGVRWLEEPDWTNGNTYQVSIMNNLAIGAEWESANA